MNQNEKNFIEAYPCDKDLFKDLKFPDWIVGGSNTNSGGPGTSVGSPATAATNFSNTNKMMKYKPTQSPQLQFSSSEDIRDEDLSTSIRISRTIMALDLEMGSNLGLK